MRNYRKLLGIMVVGMTLAQCFFASNGWSAVPAAPVMTVTTSGLSVTISWSAVTGATGYTLYYAPYPYTGSASIKNLDRGTQTSLSATLREGAAYYVAVKAYNATESSGYSNIEHFTLTTTSTSGSTVTDVEGNVYNTVTIGTQTWMKENLKVTKYRDGTAIGTTTSTTVGTETSPKYQWAYDGAESNVSTYGRLYTWFAATDSRGLCPSRWHLPTDAEWTTLTTYLGGLGGAEVAAGKMKEAGTSHWYDNTGSDNSSGFTALPGGYRYFFEGSFTSLGYNGYWWSATEYKATDVWIRALNYDTSRCGELRQTNSTHMGLSVRCVGD
jgi:uncharacterized protein (TIGR02145 family)